MSGEALLARLVRLMIEYNISYELIHHAPMGGTAEAAALRGMARSVGVKALLMKLGGRFTLVALRAHQELDNRALRHAVGAQKLRFARGDELLSWTGCLPGQVPPVGEPLLPLPLVADRGVLAGDRVAFTAGTHTDSVILSTEGWLALARPRLLDFARPHP